MKHSTSIWSIVLLFTCGCVVQSAVASFGGRCRPAGGLRGINLGLLWDSNEEFSPEDEYFCSETAPKQLRCTCGISTACQEKNDPWGRNIGVCGCCPAWLVVFFIFFTVVCIFTIVSSLYVFCCRGKWWFDGYPKAIQPAISRRGPAMLAPASAPLPPTLFRGYRASDFASEVLPQGTQALPGLDEWVQSEQQDGVREEPGSEFM
ncbi:hypothetical protein ERJ75_001418800 [Trypanosoma vivax]|uniref:Enriched in surface-labeled proteome protein 11 n=1 Tax=Trypanosoma vivax (strain Y486) TaxID=1055687 RepID=G0TUI9_TRYVY|nr:hypothetical protein TRVL_03711 [Trypanosoma vivax]KAH8607394.1 hypothetical protein ERJ75_001418800 [Trypanosoma vivax]CCC47623.1 conserved hypothetical protein [Trypanosoma vivax Y486]